MPFDPYNPAAIQRLRGHMTWSLDALEGFRKVRIDLVRQYVGSHYCKAEGASDKVPIGMIRRFVVTMGRALTPQRPRASVSTAVAALKAQAATLEVEINDELTRLELEKPLRAAGIDSLFALGLVRVGIKEHGSSEVGGATMGAGDVYVEPIDLDDAVFDMGARKWGDVKYIGHRYRMYLEEAAYSPLFDEQARSLLRPNDESRGSGDDDMVEFLSGAHEQRFTEELEPTVDLWDVYIPRLQAVVTLPDVEGGSGIGEIPLAVTPFDGPAHGPFHVLKYFDVPRNLMPLSPTSTLLDLHDTVNVLWNKTVRQGQRQKTVTLVRDGSSDGDTILQANDGDMRGVEDPTSVGEARFGGPESMNLALAMQAKAMFSEEAGNLDLLAGLGPQSETLGQDQLLQENASALTKAMTDAVLDFTAGIVRSIGWYLWTDPMLDRQVIKTGGLKSVAIPVRVSEELRQGSFYDYNFKIDPYSQQHTTPSERLAMLMRFLQGAALPLLPEIMRQGGSLNVAELFALVAKWSGITEFADIVKFTGRPPDPHELARGDPVSPPNTTRTNVRVNRTGTTPRGRDQMLMQSLMGNRLQQGEAQSLFQEPG